MLKRQAHSRYRILLVDDEEDIVHVLRKGLESRGFSVDAYSSPQKALDSFEPGAYDLAILDIRMPGMSGFALYRSLKERDHSLVSCFLSAFELHESEFQKVFPSIADGIKAIVKKPVTLDALVGEISPILRLSSAIRSTAGEHLLIVFETPTEMIEQSLEFLKAGLENDENVMFVTDAIPLDAVRAKVKAVWTDVDIDNLETCGRLVFHDWRGWYMSDGKFDLEHAIEQFTKMVNQSISEGRKGFRCVGDMNPFFSSGMVEEALRYEEELGKRFDMPVIAVCAYTKENIDRLDEAAIRLLHRKHYRVLGGT